MSLVLQDRGHHILAGSHRGPLTAPEAMLGSLLHGPSSHCEPVCFVLEAVRSTFLF